MSLRLVDDTTPARSSRERLAEAVDRAIAGCGGSIDRAIATLSAEVERDGALARVAFAASWDLVVGNLVRHAVSMRGAARRFEPHAPKIVDDFAPPARPVAVGAGGSVHFGSGAGVQPSPGAAAGRPAAAARGPRMRSAAALVAVARVAASILDSHRTELGRPLGDCSRADLVDLAGRSRRRGAFYAALAERLPDDGTVRDHCPAAEVDALWSRVGMANGGGVA